MSILRLVMLLKYDSSLKCRKQKLRKLSLWIYTARHKRIATTSIFNFRENKSKCLIFRVCYSVFLSFVGLVFLLAWRSSNAFSLLGIIDIMLCLWTLTNRRNLWTINVFTYDGFDVFLLSGRVIIFCISSLQPLEFLVFWICRRPIVILVVNIAVI